jgi:hypothetical protein
MASKYDSLINGDIIQASHTALLNLPALPLAAQKAHLFPHLKNNALISIGQLCDNGFHALFTKTHVQILHHLTVVLCGTRDKTNGLWQITLNSEPPATSINNTSHGTSLANSTHKLSIHNTVYKMSIKSDPLFNTCTSVAFIPPSWPGSKQ